MPQEVETSLEDNIGFFSPEWDDSADVLGTIVTADQNGTGHDDYCTDTLNEAHRTHKPITIAG